MDLEEERLLFNHARDLYQLHHELSVLAACHGSGVDPTMLRDLLRIIIGLAKLARVELVGGSIDKFEPR